MKDKMPVRVRLDPDYSGFEQQVIGWADSDGPDMADWPVYVRADLAPSPTPDVRGLEAENARLREALKKITWALSENRGDMEARSLKVARAALATQSAAGITDEMVERAVAAALPELQRREAVMADPMTLDRMQARRVVRAALTAALATQEAHQ